MTKEEWKAHYRQLRVIRREYDKYLKDFIYYGTGFIKVGVDIPDGIQHVPISEWAA